MQEAKFKQGDTVRLKQHPSVTFTVEDIEWSPLDNSYWYTTRYVRFSAYEFQLDDWVAPKLLRSIPRHRFVENEYDDGSYIYQARRYDFASIAAVTPDGTVLVYEAAVEVLNDDELLELIKMTGFRSSQKHS